MITKNYNSTQSVHELELYALANGLAWPNKKQIWLTKRESPFIGKTIIIAQSSPGEFKPYLTEYIPHSEMSFKLVFSSRVRTLNDDSDNFVVKLWHIIKYNS